jgi:hypothetical protein
MSRKAIVIANHKTKTATLNFVDEENNKVATDHNNQALVGMKFPYSNIEEYDFMFESLGKIDDENEKFEFKISVS